MNNRTKSLLYAATIGLIIVAIFLGFLSSMANPVSWVLIVVLALVPLIYKKTNQSNQLEWQEEYSVGIESLDNDHKKLINLLNQFTTAYDYAMSEDFERQALSNLIAYTKYHFEREENLLVEHNFIDVEAHKKQHKVMIAQVESFVSLYDEKGHDALSEVSSFLKEWLINHINGTDKEYTQCLTAHGVK